MVGKREGAVSCDFGTDCDLYWRCTIGRDAGSVVSGFVAAYACDSVLVGEGDCAGRTTERSMNHTSYPFSTRN
jgi:hypothetical protein